LGQKIKKTFFPILFLLQNLITFWDKKIKKIFLFLNFSKISKNFFENLEKIFEFFCEKLSLFLPGGLVLRKEGLY
jgi:hypothetical protein